MSDPQNHRYAPYDTPWGVLCFDCGLPAIDHDTDPIPGMMRHLEDQLERLWPDEETTS